jgi:hypothetical protein
MPLRYRVLLLPHNAAVAPTGCRYGGLAPLWQDLLQRHAAPRHSGAPAEPSGVAPATAPLAASSTSSSAAAPGGGAAATAASAGGPFCALVGGGDQLYNDDVWQVPALEVRCGMLPPGHAGPGAYAPHAIRGTPRQAGPASPFAQAALRHGPRHHKHTALLCATTT